MYIKSQSSMIHQHKKINHSTNLNNHLSIAEVRSKGLVILVTNIISVPGYTELSEFA